MYIVSTIQLLIVPGVALIQILAAFGIIFTNSNFIPQVVVKIIIFKCEVD